ncbi:MAG: OsmC family protein [Candidatus Odinarchaeia archaeon]
MEEVFEIKVNKEKLLNSIQEMVKLLKEDPEKGKAVFTTETSLAGNLKTKAIARDFVIKSDEPPELGGENTAPNPIELVLAALGNCQAITYVAYSIAMRIPIKDVRVLVKGYIDLQGFFGVDDSVDPGFYEIFYETTIVSDQPKERIEQLVAAVESHCPVLDILSRPIKINNEINIVIG